MISLKKLIKDIEHLLTYFNTLKNEQITQLIERINTVEASYEDCYQRNNNMLSLLQILMDNYDGSIEMKNNILNNKINIYKCKDNMQIDDSYDLVQYYNDYIIVNKKEIEEVKLITDHRSNVHSLLLLKYKRIASCSYNTIRIYDPSNDYHCDQVLTRHTKCIKSICELDDGTIVSCSFDKSIIIGDYTIKNAHKCDWIYKVIPFLIIESHPVQMTQQ